MNSIEARRILKNSGLPKIAIRDDYETHAVRNDRTLCRGLDAWPSSWSTPGRSLAEVTCEDCRAIIYEILSRGSEFEADAAAASSPTASGQRAHSPICPGADQVSGGAASEGGVEPRSGNSGVVTPPDADSPAATAQGGGGATRTGLDL